MNKNAIKKFAIDARNKLIASVTDKAGMLGITPDNCSEAITKGADFEVYKTAAGTEVTLNKKQCEQRRKLVDQIHASGFEAVVEEVAYTWFNRICHMTAPDFKTRLQKDLVGNLQGTYSRRINIQHRLVYQVYNEPVVVDGVDYEGTVKIIRMWTYYDKVR